MNENQLVLLLNLIKKWWNGEALTEGATRAQVLLILKKGNKAGLGNYLPISLRNANFKNKQQRHGDVTNNFGRRIGQTLTDNTIWVQTQEKHGARRTLRKKSDGTGRKDTQQPYLSYSIGKH